MDQLTTPHTFTDGPGNTASGEQVSTNFSEHEDKINELVALTQGMFRARRTSSQSIAASTTAKVQLTTEDIDPDNWFDPTTNYRYTPQVAGYYHLDLTAKWSISDGYWELKLYKNGSEIKSVLMPSAGTAGTNGATLSFSDVVQANGSSDYFEMYATNNDAGSARNLTAAYFSGHRIA